jgi:hypothetical protein
MAAIEQPASAQHPAHLAFRLDTVDARIVARMRAGLVLAGLFIIWLDPTEPARFVELTYASLIVYGAWSLALAATAGRPAMEWVHRYAPWIDVACAAYLVALTQGTSSIFFFMFLFAILVASFSQGYREGVFVTAAATALFAIVGFTFAPPEPAFELNRYLIRTIYLFGLGWMIAYWGGREITLRQRLMILQEIGSQWNPRIGVDRTISVNLERLLDFFRLRRMHPGAAPADEPADLLHIYGLDPPHPPLRPPERDLGERGERAPRAAGYAGGLVSRQRARKAGGAQGRHARQGRGFRAAEQPLRCRALRDRALSPA